MHFVGVKSSVPLWIACLIGLAGCQSKHELELYPVTGKVTLDGKPCAGALVTLFAADEVSISRKLDKAPTAYCKADGSFVVGTYELEDGSPEGTYDVSIFWFTPNAHEIMSKTGKVPNLLPSSYSDPKTSGLEIKVASGKNEVPEFKLSKK